MFVLFASSSYSGSVLSEEVCHAVEIGESALMESAIKNAAAELYALERSSCGSIKSATLCLFLYTYALEAWCAQGDNYINETQLTAILACVEQTSKTCCNGV
jgi:hypothetical protein